MRHPITYTFIIAIHLLISTAYCHTHFHVHDERHLLDEEVTRCGHDSPSLEEKLAIQKDLDRYKRSIGAERLKANKESIIIVNVYFHVLTTTDGLGEVTQEQVEKQIQVMNDSFSGVTGSSSCNCLGLANRNIQAATTPFRFVLADTIRIKNDMGFYLDNEVSFQLRKQNRKGSCGDLNIYTGSSQLLGASPLASQCPNDGTNPGVPRATDYIILNYRTVPDGEHGAYDQGKTLVHEVGHWLGLLHTFEGGCNNDGGGDGIDDTPTEAAPARGCDIGRNTCAGGGDDPIHNFMDYSRDCCVNHFTHGQGERMVLQAGLYRGLKPETNPDVIQQWMNPSQLSADDHTSEGIDEDCVFCDKVAAIFKKGVNGMLRGASDGSR